MDNQTTGWALGRGANLGLVWTLVFFGAALLLYLIMGVVGWSGAARAICALLVAPVFAVGAIVVWWMVRRPTFTPPGTLEQTVPTKTFDPNRTRIGRPTAPLRLPNGWWEKDKHNDDTDAE